MPNADPPISRKKARQSTARSAPRDKENSPYSYDSDFTDEDTTVRWYDDEGYFNTQRDGYGEVFHGSHRKRMSHYCMYDESEDCFFRVRRKPGDGSWYSDKYIPPYKDGKWHKSSSKAEKLNERLRKAQEACRKTEEEFVRVKSKKPSVGPCYAEDR